MAFGLIIGNFTSALFLIIFYYTLFALVAVPFRLFGKTVTQKARGTNWVPKEKTLQTLEDYKNKY